MHARRNGFVTLLLMMVPMLAVPVMAIFGIPQFAPVIASPTPSSDSDPHEFRERRVGHSAIEPDRKLDLAAAEGLDLFRPYDAQSATSRTPEELAQRQRVASWSDPLKGADTRRTNDAPPISAASTLHDAGVRSSRPMHQQVSDIFSDDFSRDPASKVAQHAAANRAATVPQPTKPALSEARPLRLEVPQLNWGKAVERLNACGAGTYRLTPGLRQDDFRFVCLVTSADDLRITRRFEAESSDPLVAVEKVLAQVERWHSQPGMASR